MFITHGGLSAVEKLALVDTSLPAVVMTESCTVYRVSGCSAAEGARSTWADSAQPLAAPTSAVALPGQALRSERR